MTNIFDRFASAGDQQERRGAPNPRNAQQTAEHSLAHDPAAARADDQARTPGDVKAAVQELLKYGYLEESSRQELFRRLVVHANAVTAILEPLDLAVRIDSHRGVAFLAIAQLPSEPATEDAGWTHPLVRKQRLTLEQSLLVAILRQLFMMHEQEFGVGQTAAKTTVDELLPHFLTFFGDSGSDARNESRLLQLLDQLKTYGIVSEVDKKHELIIRPLIAHLANPASLVALLHVLKEQRSDAFGEVAE